MLREIVSNFPFSRVKNTLVFHKKNTLNLKEINPGSVEHKTQKRADLEQKIFQIFKKTNKQTEKNTQK